MEETVPKDTLCVPQKYHGGMPKSWPKSLSMRRMTDHGIELLPEAKVPAKNAYHMTSPELAVLRKQSKILSDIRPRHCRVRATKAEGLKATCVTGLRAYEFLVVPFNLADAKGGKYCSVQRQINVLGHVVEFHQIEGRKKKITATCDERIPKSVIELRSYPGLANSNGQFTDGFLQRGASSMTKLLEEEDIQWGGNLEQGNWAPLLNVAQFGHNTQTDSLIRIIQFEIKGNRHFVLPPLADGPCVKDDPQVHKVEEEWEQMADITRVCLEEASRLMKEREEDREVKEVLANGERTDAEDGRAPASPIDEDVNRLSGRECHGHTCPSRATV
ncbi:RNA-directed DNA polymerase-like protein [Cucumis melo var. makuwa]|uniref:RNA-directed DNA polymerase-like protein n=1 Tax=Cucumis melo var. makuwa TaxID=1194695 RepID=A0A5D3DPW5_CUCMM|nr:RNA-directed DNA polymerase-like protein [Cucumis melo var. makuwa]TYK25716.1 RNA-directed DNA polymerase-like protein [Cucumis melo var. makuwa]